MKRNPLKENTKCISRHNHHSKKEGKNKIFFQFYFINNTFASMSIAVLTAEDATASAIVIGLGVDSLTPPQKKTIRKHKLDCFNNLIK